jgi:hypothetical protein
LVDSVQPGCAGESAFPPDSGLLSPDSTPPRLSKKERKRLRRANSGRIAITKRERKRLGKLLHRVNNRPVHGPDDAWVAKQIAQMQAKQNAAWEKQTIVPSKAMQLRLDRAARDMRIEIERGTCGILLTLLDVRYWDFRMAFDGVKPDSRLSAGDVRSLVYRTRAGALKAGSCVYDWWLALDAHTRNSLLEMVRLEVGETAVAYRPTRKCPYCGKVVRVIDRDRDEWPFLAKHRRRRGDAEDCRGSFYVIEDLTDVTAQPRE